MANEPTLTDAAVVGAAQGAIGAATNLLNLLPTGAGGTDNIFTQAELEDVATDLALALRASLRFMPTLDEGTGQLLAAVEKWLP